MLVDTTPFFVLLNSANKLAKLHHTFHSKMQTETISIRCQINHAADKTPIMKTVKKSRVFQLKIIISDQQSRERKVVPERLCQIIGANRTYSLKRKFTNKRKQNPIAYQNTYHK